MSGLFADITYLEARAAVQLVTDKLSHKSGVSTSDLDQRIEDIRSEFGAELPEIAYSKQESIETVGPYYISIIEAMLDSDDEFLRSEMEHAVLAVKGSGRVQAVGTIFAVGAVVVAIGLLSKIEVTEKGKILIHKGFPDIEKIPELVGKFFGR